MHPLGHMEDGLQYGPLKVLVAEDDAASRETLQKAVRMLGHDCRAARNGLDAWHMHLDEHADVILSDWRMPRMDGLELCRRMRAAETDGRYTYFVFLTDFNDHDHRTEGMAAGADDYRSKPIDLDDLQGRLESAARALSLRAKR